MGASQEFNARAHASPPGDDVLLRAIAAGDERAFTIFYLRHAAGVARVVHLSGANTPCIDQAARASTDGGAPAGTAKP
jgi:hypothetical protein